MPILDFKEIPTAAKGADRDQFELFAHEFLKLAGLLTVVGPDRGPDAGRDMVMEEVRTGVAGETRVSWLVSCKHKAHSGAAVSPDDETDINDRLKTHRCGGFLGFYSTVPSSGLAAKLNADGRSFELQVYHPERIETELLASSDGRNLAKRFFPVSWEKWNKEHPKPADLLFKEAPEFSCAYCHKSLLDPEPHGIIVLWTSLNSDHTEYMYWCCNGACDRALQQRFRKPGIVDGWEDLRDFLIPMTFIRWVATSFNSIHAGATYSDDAMEKFKTLLLNSFPLICRDMTENEKERIKSLTILPAYLGGWGYG